MKSFLLLLIAVCVMIFSDIKPQTQPVNHINTDSLITAVVSHVNSDSIRYVIQSLQNFQTRYLLAPNRFSIADWIENRFYEIGITDVKRDSFMCHTNYSVDTTTLQINIVATIPGTVRPDEIYIIGGHFDSFAYGSPLTNAPGADDNASGTSAALEFARALIGSGYRPEATIKFITFAAEELMLFGDAGCEHYAQKAKNDSMNIMLMVNCDMISHTASQLSQSKVSINYYTGFLHLRDLAINSVQQFSLITPVIGAINQYSDSYPFYEQGFPSVYFEEYNFSPYYHTTNDIISNYNMDYCGEVIKSAGATLLKFMFQNSPTDLEIQEIIRPGVFSLEQNFPNPFNPSTKISWQSSISGWQTLKIYDVLGNEVTTLVNEYKDAGSYETEFSAIGGSVSGGNVTGLSSGVYFYQIVIYSDKHDAGSFVQTRKMLLIK